MKHIKAENLLTDEMFDILIDRTQKVIDEEVKKQLKIEPDLDKAQKDFDSAVAKYRHAYDEIKNIWDTQQAIIDKEQDVLQRLLRQKQMGGVYIPKEPFRSKSRTKARHRIMWTDNIKKILSELNEFSDVKFLVEKVIVSDPEAKSANLSGYEKSSTASYIRTLAKKNQAGFVYWDGRIGLVEWTNGHGVINPEYIKPSSLPV